MRKAVLIQQDPGSLWGGLQDGISAVKNWNSGLPSTLCPLQPCPCWCSSQDERASLPPERLGSCLTRLGSGVAPLLSWILDFSLFHKVPAHGDSDRHRGQIAWLVGKGLSELLSWLFPVWTNISVMLWNKTTFGFFFFFLGCTWVDILGMTGYPLPKI